MAKKLFGGKETYKEELAEAKAIKSGKITPAQYAKGEKSEGVHGMKKGGGCKMTRGGGVAQKGVGRGTEVKMAKGGGVEIKGKTKGRNV